MLKRLSSLNITTLIIAVVLIAVVAVTALQLLGGSKNKDTTSDKKASVSFLIFGDPAEKAAYETLVAEFERAHPEIDINLQHIASQADYRARLGADFAAGTPSDIVLINYRRYAQFAGKNQLEPLGLYLEQSSLIQESDFYPETIEPFKWQGELMCIPQNLSSLVVYYNKSLFDAAGLAYPSDDWTWDEFLATAQALTLDLDGDGTIDQYGVGIEPSIFRLAPFVWQNGGDITNGKIAPSALTLDTPESREALEWFIALQTVHHVVPDAVAEGAEESESRFLNGRLGMFFNSRRGVPTYREIEGFDWDVAALPVGRQPAGILHSDAYCMAAATKDKAAAWTFIEFANAAVGQAIIAKTGRTVPSLIIVANSEAFLDPTAKPANSKAFLDTVPYIRYVPIMPTWVDIETKVGEDLENVFYGHTTIDEFLDSAKQRTAGYFSGAETY